MRIRRKCGSSSATSILPIVRPLAERLAVGVRRYFNRKTNSPRFIDSQQDIAVVRTYDIARDRETEPVAALLGSKQRLEDAGHNLGGDRSLWINYVDSYLAVTVLLSVEFHQVTLMACIDCVQHQVQERLMHLGRIEISLEAAVDGDVDRYAFIGRMRARDGCDVVQSVGKICPRDLHWAWTGVDQEVCSEPFETHGFFRRDREHFFSLRFVLTRPDGGRQ